MNRNLRNAFIAAALAVLSLTVAMLLWSQDQRLSSLVIFCAIFSSTLCGGSLAYWWFWVRQ